VFGKRRRPKPWQDELRRYKAHIARAKGWAPADADDASALQAFKGRGRRTDLVRAVPVTEWERPASLKFTVEGCCTWVDNLRSRRILSAAALAEDLRTYGITQTSPSLLDVLPSSDDLTLPQAAYRRARNRIGRAVLVALLQPGCPDPKHYLQEWRKRTPRWPRRRIELSPEAAQALNGFVQGRARVGVETPL
jgi:hypothetical protein